MTQCLSSMGIKTTVISLANPLAARKVKSAQVNENLVIFFSHVWDRTVLRKLLLADIVQFEYPYLLPVMLLLRILGKRFVLDEHGVEFQFIRELKKIPETTGNSRSIGFMLKKMPGLSPIVLGIEKLAVTISSLVFACSDNDASEIRRLYGPDKAKVKVVPNCADPAFFDTVAPKKFGRSVDLFLGSFDHPPNVHGASVLLSRIVPHVREKVKDVRFVLVGKNPPQWLVRQASENVVFTGEVEDLRPLVMGADVVVAPIFSGSGTRQKIVDYMAFGKPIVSTTKGAEGLDLEDEVDFLQRDTVEGFCDAIVQLLEDRNRAQLLGRRVREIARVKYSWDVQIIEVLEAYEEIMKKNAVRKATPRVEN